jgi:5-methylcytosine-specific restriction enzyme subunit McrC
MGKETITVTEYGAIGCGGKPASDKFLCGEAVKKTFDALKKFNTDNDDSIFTLTTLRKEGGGSVEALKAKSYVGVIETKCGRVVEILPKILPKKDGAEEDVEKTRKIFLNMLRCLRDSPFKEIDTAHLQTIKNHLLEVFISLFLKDLEKLIQRGIAKDYLNIEDNQTFLKGKLLFNQNIKSNTIHKERFFVSFDEFITNRPENRLIKSTLLFLSKIARINNNQKRIREFIFTLDEIPCSENIDNDLTLVKANNNRLIYHYEKILNWCRVFLQKESFTNFKGKAVSLALLFPMEKVFEDFVGTMFKRAYPDKDVRLQHKKHHLIEVHNGYPKFALIPDIVMTEKENRRIFDTKWKLINKDKPKDNYDISQGDCYQMFAYGEKYKSNELYLLYPKNDNFASSMEFKFYTDKKMKLFVCPVDLKEVFNENNKQRPEEKFKNMIPFEGLEQNTTA